MNDSVKTLAQMKKATKLVRLAQRKNGPKSYKRGQGALLRELLANDGATQRELVNKLGLSRGALKDVVRKAQRNGYVTIEEVEGKKTYALRLTDDGHKIAEKHEAAQDKTADEILADVMGMYAQVNETTMDVERPDTLVLPSDVYNTLSMKRIPDTDQTVFGFIKDHAPHLKEIVSAAELNAKSVETNPYAAASNGQGVAFLFTNDIDKLEINIPLAFTQGQVERRGLEVVIPCESRVAGVIVYYPMSALVAIGV